MKKPAKKLQLNRETVRKLSHLDLGQVAGGECSAHICPTVCTQQAGCNTVGCGPQTVFRCL